MPLLLGVDIGTSGAKTVLTDCSGAVRAEAFAEYPMEVPRPGWAEQDPQAWWRAAVEGISRVLAGVPVAEVAGVGLTGQMHGLVLCDEQGEVLRPCIMWNDQRTARQCTEIEEKVGREKLIAVTGKPALTGFTAGKLLWVRDNEPEVFRRAAHLLMPKDFVRYRLTNRFQTDVSEASGTNLFDVGRRRWSGDIVEALGIDARLLPEAFESQQVSAEVSGEAAYETGLRPGTPVVAGAGDQAAQAIGTGIANEGTVSVTVGTSGVVFAATHRYTFDAGGGLHAYCHAVPERWHLMGVTLAAGGSVRWFRDTFGSSYPELDAEAARVKAGAEGLLYLPYLSGERTPHADPDARGVFFGLSFRHGRAEMFRAVLEGVAFSLKDGLDLLCALGTNCGRIRLSGGGAASPIWRQIMADVFGAELVTLNVVQGAAWGAALLAGAGTGCYASVAGACAAAIAETGSTQPGPDARRYAELHERYKALYPALKPEFKALARAAGPSG